MNTTRKTLHASFIDGLRAIAVLSVIAYHLNSTWLPGGFAGVDVFFVISGFVVAISVSALGELSLARFLAYFYARRLARIVPALVVMLLVTFVASTLVIPGAWLSSSNQKTGLFAFLGLSNFILAANAGNYFSPIAEFNPFTHTWSLAVEEQFYLAFPWLFALWLRGYRKASIALFGLSLAASFVCAIWLGKSNETLAFYMLWSRFWELGIGVLLFQGLHAFGHSFGDTSPRRRWCAAAGDAGLLAIAAGLIMARPETAPFPACVLPVAGTAIMLGALHGRGGGIAQFLLTRRPMVFIGKISYSLYLWHWPVFVLFRWTIGLESHKCQAAALALTFVLAIASHFLIERAPRKAAASVKKRVAIAVGLVLMVSGYLASSAVASNERDISLSTVARNHDLWYPEGPGTIRTVNGCTVTLSTRSFDGGMVSVFERTGCAVELTFAHNVFVLGDSHAMAYTGMMKQFVARTGAAVYAYNVGGCPFISLQPWVAGRDDTCKAFGDASVADMLPKIRPGDIVFLASLRLPRMVDQWAVFGEDHAKVAMFSETAREGREQGVQKAIPQLKQFSARGARIVFEAPTPMLESIPYRCSDWFNHNNPICARGMSVPRFLLEELRAPVLESYSEMEQAVPGVKTWDPLPALCPGSECNAYRNGKPLLFDGDHLSYYSNMLLLPSFSAFVTGSDAEYKNGR